MVSLLSARKSVLVAFLSSLLFAFGYTSAIPAASMTYSQDAGGSATPSSQPSHTTQPSNSSQNDSSTQSNTSSNGNCSDDYVIHCGVNSAAEINSHMGDHCVSQIYASFGISHTQVSAMGTKAVMGDVYSNGDVKVQTTMSDGNTGYHLVATGAMTAGFANISGSIAHMCGNTAWYERPTSVSFRSSPLPAYVMLDDNGQFMFAILKDCGNPVKGTPVKPPAPAPKPQPQPTPTPQPKPTPKPQPTPQPTPTPVSQTQTQTQTQYVTVNQATQPTPAATTTTNNYYPQPQPTPAPAPAPAPTYTAPAAAPLPNTGPGNVIAFASIFGTFAGLGHYLIFGRRGTTFTSGVKYF